MKKLFVGIDNGISGGLSILDESGKLHTLASMPIQRTKKGNEIDVRWIHRWLLDCSEQSESVTVIIEEPAGSKFPKMASSMAGSFHAIRATVELLRLVYHRVTPQQWQKAVLGKLPKGQTKIAALTKARSLWPKETWLESPRCTKPHDGWVDSALIAQYGRMNNL